MRGVFFCSVAFAANAAVASVCKPRPRSSDTSALLRSTSTIQDVAATSTTLLAVPSASTSAPVSSDAGFTSLSEGIAITSDLSLSTTIDATSEQTDFTTETTSDTTTTELSTATAETATSKVDAVVPTPIIDSATVELSSTTLEEAASTETSIDVYATITIDMTTTGTDTATTELPTTEGEASSATSVSVTNTSAGTTTSGVSTTEETPNDTTRVETISSDTTAATLTPTTLETTTSMDTTTAEVSTAEQTTTTTAEATTTTGQGPWQPLPTFDLVGIGSSLSGFNGQRLSSWDIGWAMIGWKPTEPVLHLTIEPETGYLKESEGSYICVFLHLEDPDYHNRIVKCDEQLLEMPIFEHLTCEQKSDGKLVCSAPAVSCITSEVTWDFECTDLEGEFNRFYTASDGGADLLAFGSETYLPQGTQVHPIELGVAAPRSEL